MINPFYKFIFDGLGLRTLLKIFSIFHSSTTQQEKKIRNILIKSTLKSFKFYIDTEDPKKFKYPTKLYRTWGLYEPLTSLVLKKLVKEKYNVLEIGSAYGYFSIQFAKLASKGKVYAVEPNPNYYNDYLIKNIELNNQSNIKTFCTAIGNGDFIDVKTNKIKTLSFEEFCNTNVRENLDFIFIDVDARDLEGGIVRNEINILKQVFKFYSDMKKPTIFVESKDLHIISDLIKKNNYKIFKITRRHFVLLEN